MSEWMLKDYCLIETKWLRQHKLIKAQNHIYYTGLLIIIIACVHFIRLLKMLHSSVMFPGKKWVQNSGNSETEQYHNNYCIGLSLTK